MSADPDFAAVTTRTLAYLHDVRRAERERRRGRTVFALYTIVLLVAIWGVPYLVAGLHTARAGGWDGPAARRVLASLPVTAPTLVALVLYAAARDAVWRGPIRLDGPAASWLLPLPALRRRLFRPRLLGAMLVSGAAGTAAGGAAGFVLYVLGADSWPGPTAGGAFAGLLTGLGAVGVGVLVQRHDRVPLRYARRILLGVRLALLVPVALSVPALLGPGAARIGTVVSWSGPWGWATQPLLAATATRAPGWAPAGVLALLGTAALLGLAWRASGAIPAEGLRTRTALVARVTAAVLTLDPRQAGTVVRGARTTRRSRPVWRLPIPRDRRWTIPWRDATALLRAPRLPAWAGLWTTIAVSLTAAAPELPSRPRMLLCALALTGAYLAVSRLAEPARVETDDVRRAGNLPFSAGALALWHGVVPALSAITATGVGIGVCAVVGRWHPALLLLPAAVPVLTGAALVSAYRGPVPTSVLFGADTPMGNTALAQTALWYLRGPLAALAAGVPALAAAGAHDRPAPIPLACLLAAAGPMAWWVHHTARRLRGG
ncbi:DUF6297 family protein [Embleya hyalina]|uniref:Uncharacterized protein n=1 Tax=Embleya hyalina TaxID=516124 RepID=A0A401YIQ4_9ACTN|nr:DUF6297 family protein [Embleya hyalina]GCD94494.1 hypothetical protein EHYA_02163 [Embleya hyalina]